MVKKRKPKKPAPEIPQLSLEALDEVQKIEGYAKGELRDCRDSLGGDLNVEKAKRIARTCAVSVLDALLAYYESVPTFDERWIIKLQESAIESVVGMIPRNYDDKLYEWFRKLLWDTTYAHLNPPKSENKEKTKTIAEQIEALRNECRMTVEELATALDVQPRSVYRHLSNHAQPRKRQIAAYEKLFSERLDRNVILTSG